MQLNEIYSAKFFCSCTPTGQHRSVSLNVVHYKITMLNGAGPSDKQVVDTLSAIAAAPYKALLTDQSRYEGLMMQRVFPLPVLAAFASTGAAGPGTRALSEQLPLSVCGLMTKRTTGVGRKKRGRFYTPFHTENDNDAFGKPTINAMNLITDIGNAVLVTQVFGGGGNDATFTPVLFHGATQAPESSILSSVLTRPYWGTQRRRGNQFRSDQIPDFPVI